MVLLIEDLHKQKKYKPLTLYLSVSLSDRYLARSLLESQAAPCLITLATTCLLLAAKIEESVAPSTIVLLHTLKERHSIELQKCDVFNLEEKIIRALDFELRQSTPIDFLERYYRLFGIDTKRDYRGK